MDGLSRRALLGTSGMAAAGAVLWASGMRGAPAAPEKFPYQLSDADWRKKLPPLSYSVLRHEATERPFSSPLLNEHRKGQFACLGCGLPNFASTTKFDSGTGWPSFWAPLNGAVSTSDDNSLGMDRTEVHCRRCGGHLGHVFDDGPAPTHLRYCMNGAALQFIPGRS